MTSRILTLAAAGALSTLALPAFAQATASATADLNIRSGAGPAHEVVGMIPAGQEVEVSGCLEPATWCEVTHDGVTGWASGGYLTAIIDTTPVVIYESADAAGITTITYDPTLPDGTVTLNGALIAADTTGQGAQVEIDDGAITYLNDNPVEPIYLDGEVVLGAGLPETVTLTPVPESALAYANINGQAVLVAPETRRVAYIAR
ncbi:SH3 domain-containing protein [Limimaricola pyoseonensis]|uniref:Uncharacterized conserved protein YraI n=1 Tax=Limimaricola pyoseonensis TaxID=521013 RepID=A0A1G7H1H5_9RHOB|nr:SH3 domain-containing protein [Limimaricola pyoseonensis]SDE93999.1 Uncharacterized conserved protein YraI [Limimaricola pyoseonensis]